MHVVATAGHVDHGKSTLVHALTGQQPDRLAQERERGLSIELGYCWTQLPRAGDVAFVDVPGHERFVTTMLSGVGSVPVVMFVVAADDPWMPQAAEHLAALDALRVRHGVLVVTRADLADPAPALARAREQLSRTSLAEVPHAVVSGATGEGLAGLRGLLDEILASLPVLAADAPVRLWVDRVFTRPGAGTVVTGTLPAGEVRPGDVLMCGDEQLRVRGLQTLGREVDVARGVARVSLRLGSHVPAGLARGVPLTTPDGWWPSAEVDIVVDGDDAPPREPMLHVGSASTAVRLRVLDGGVGGRFARLTLPQPLPWHVGDRVLLRDPGRRTVWGASVLDPAPPLLRRRGDARRRATTLAAEGHRPDAAAEVRRRGVVTVDDLRRLGVPAQDPVAGAVPVGDTLVAEQVLADWRRRLASLVDEHRRSAPLEPGVPARQAVRELGLPRRSLLDAVVRPPLRLVDGRVQAPGTALDPRLVEAVTELRRALADRPFEAPDARRLDELGLDRRALAAAERAGQLVRLTDTVVLSPDAPQLAADRLRELPQPFRASEARELLGTTRRVALPLLEHLDRLGLTGRLPDDRRRVRH